MDVSLVCLWKIFEFDNEKDASSYLQFHWIQYGFLSLAVFRFEKKKADEKVGKITWDGGSPTLFWLDEKIDNGIIFHARPPIELPIALFC